VFPENKYYLEKVMKHQFTSIIASVALVAGLSFSSFSQELEILGSAGTEASSSGASISYTVGELVVETGVSSSSVLTQGYQQGFLTPTAIDEVPSELELSLYPNPTSEFLIIESVDLNKFDQITMYDINGKLLWSENGNSHVENRLRVDFTPYAAGNYILKMVDSQNQESYSYSVVKSH
jgi:hypothetical protein